MTIFCFGLSNFLTSTVFTLAVMSLNEFNICGGGEIAMTREDNTNEAGSKIQWTLTKVQHQETKASSWCMLYQHCTNAPLSHSLLRHTRLMAHVFARAFVFTILLSWVCASSFFFDDTFLNLSIDSKATLSMFLLLIVVCNISCV